MAKKTEQETTTTATAPRWTLGLFRSKKGKLATVYVNKDGVPMPYEQKRVDGAEILFYQKYVGMPYREARQLLLKDAAAAGIVAEIAPEDASEGKDEAEPVIPAKPKAKKAGAKKVSRSVLPKADKPKAARKPRAKKAAPQPEA